MLTQFNSASLNRHLARTYRFDNFSQGFVNTLAAEQTPENQNWFQGTADAVRQSIRHFSDIEASHVLILSGDQLYQMDFQKLLQFHSRSRADITVSTIPVPRDQASMFGILKTRDDNQIVHFHEKPGEQELSGLESQLSAGSLTEQFPEGKAFLASMGIYVFSKQMLIEILNASVEHDFGKHIIPESIHKYRVMSYPFFGYWTDIGTIRSFYEANLDLTSTLPKFNFYSSRYPIYTRARLLPGSKVNDCNLHQCVISDGCFLMEPISGTLLSASAVELGQGQRSPILTSWGRIIMKRWRKSKEMCALDNRTLGSGVIRKSPTRSSTKTPALGITLKSLILRGWSISIARIIT